MVWHQRDKELVLDLNDGKHHGRIVSLGNNGLMEWILNEFVFSTHSAVVNSLTPGRCGGNFKDVISKHMLWIKFLSTASDIALRWMPQITFDD